MSVETYTTYVLVCPAVINLGDGQYTTLSMSTESVGLSPSGIAFTNSSSLTPTATSPSSGNDGPTSTLFASPAETAGTYVLVEITTTLTVSVFPTGLTTFDGYRPTYEDYGDVSAASESTPLSADTDPLSLIFNRDH